MLIYYPSYVFKVNKYFHWYRSIIQNSHERNKNLKEYTEIHHILPSSIFPQFSNLKKNFWNSSKLTFREHFLAHWLLTKCMVQEKHKRQMQNAMLNMGFSNKFQKRVNTSWQYELMKKSAKDSALLRWNDTNYKINMSNIMNSKEYVEKQSNNKKQLWKDKEFKQTMIEIHNSEATKSKKSESIKDLWKDPTFREKQSKIIKETSNTPQEKERRSKASKKMWDNPEFIKENTFCCDCCNRKIIGAANWNRHINSKLHITNSKTS